MLATGLLAAGAAACSSDNEQDAAPSAASSTSTSQSGSESADETSTSSVTASGPDTGPVPVVRLDGEAVAAEFQPVRCEWGTDEGHPQLEFDAGQGSTGGDLEVEIVMADPPKLDDFALETTEVDWEANSDQRVNARIDVDGETYHVVSQVTEDDGARTAELDITFTCASQ